MRRILHVTFLPGIVAVLLVTGIAHSQIRNPPYPFGTQNSVFAYLALALIHGLMAHTAGLPDEVEDMQPAFAAASLASMLATASWLIVQTVFPGLLPRWVILVAAVAVPLVTFLFAALSVFGRRHQARRDRVFAVLSADDAATLRIDADATFPQPEVAFALAGIVELGDLEPQTAEALQTLVERSEASLIVLSEVASRDDAIFQTASALHRNGLTVNTLTDFYARHFGKLPVAELSRMALLFDVRDRQNPVYRHVKRAIDIVGGIAAGAACTIAVPFVFLGNAAANRGPLLFRQHRVGRDGETFTIVKFRTMRHDLDLDSVRNREWASIDDSRITRFGRVLRRAHIDELPQAWNILRGDLSLVGPRPEQPHYVEDLSAKEAAYGLRHLVTPGLTGWAQVKYRYAATEAAALEKLQYDLFYISRQSLSLDLRILSRTVRSVLRRRGR